MSKLLFFIPAIIFTLFYGMVAFAFGGLGAIHPIVWVFIASVWIAGILLSKSVFWGGFFGMIPAVSFIYMGTQDTGQIFSETPIGVVFFLYYAVCIYYVYRKNISKRH